MSSSPAPDRDVTVRYWAAAKAAAGTADESVAGATLAEVLDEVRARHADDDRFARVLSVASFLVDEQPLGGREASDVALRGGETVDVLPPFAGG